MIPAGIFVAYGKVTGLPRPLIPSSALQKAFDARGPKGNVSWESGQQEGYLWGV